MLASEVRVVAKGKPGVGEVLAGWMNRRHLNPTTLARLAQLSRAAVYVVLDSRSKNPDTMRQLARGLATDPSDPKAIDPSIERAAGRDLLRAAGYEPLVESPAATEADPAAAVATGAPIRLGRYRLIPTAIRAAAGPHGWTLDGGGMPIDEEFFGSGDLIVITVTCDCMEPEIQHGERVMVDVSRKRPRPGDVVFVWSLEEECLVRRYTIEGGAPALTDNTGRVLRPNGTRIEGTVIGSFRKF